MTPTLKCPKCHAIWPKESEAGERIGKSGDCPKCESDVGKRLTARSRERLLATLAECRARDEAKGYATERDLRKALDRSLLSESGNDDIAEAAHLIPRWVDLPLPDGVPWRGSKWEAVDRNPIVLWNDDFNTAPVGRILGRTEERRIRIELIPGPFGFAIAEGLRLGAVGLHIIQNAPVEPIIAVSLVRLQPTPRPEDSTPGCCEEGDRVISWDLQRRGGADDPVNEVNLPAPDGCWTIETPTDRGTVLSHRVSFCCFCGTRLPE